MVVGRSLFFHLNFMEILELLGIKVKIFMDFFDQQ